MWPDQVSNPGPLALESDVLLTALCSLADDVVMTSMISAGHMLQGRVAHSVGHLTRKSGVLGSIPGLATYFRFSFRFFKKSSCQLLAKVCARSTG